MINNCSVKMNSELEKGRCTVYIVKEAPFLPGGEINGCTFYIRDSKREIATRKFRESSGWEIVDGIFCGWEKLGLYLKQTLEEYQINNYRLVGGFPDDIFGDYPHAQGPPTNIELLCLEDALKVSYDKLSREPWYSGYDFLDFSGGHAIDVEVGSENKEKDKNIEEKEFLNSIGIKTLSSFKIFYGNFGEIKEGADLYQKKLTGHLHEPIWPSYGKWDERDKKRIKKMAEEETKIRFMKGILDSVQFSYPNKVKDEDYLKVIFETFSCRCGWCPVQFFSKPLAIEQLSQEDKLISHWYNKATSLGLEAVVHNIASTFSKISEDDADKVMKKDFPLEGNQLSTMLKKLERSKKMKELNYFSLLLTLDHDSWPSIKPYLEKIKEQEKGRKALTEIAGSLLDYTQKGKVEYDFRYGLGGFGTPLTQMAYKCAVNIYGLLSVDEKSVEKMVDMDKVMRDR